MDGSIVFGGWDTAKTTGPNFTQPIGSQGSCTGNLFVDITDMTLVFSDGTSHTLMPGGSSLPACLEPDWPVVVSFPYSPYFERFESLTDTLNIGRESNPGFTFWGTLFSSESVYVLLYGSMSHKR